MRIRHVEWPRGIRDKVEGKHGLSPDEVEWAILDRRAYIRVVGRNRYFVFGRSDAGAYIVSVVEYARGKATVISARAMTPQERRVYQRRGK